VDTHPPDPLLVHRLPLAPNFVGRETELAVLRDRWRAGFRGVLALIGLGGAGKTAVAARFLEQLLGAGGTARPAGLLVWSFYQEPDAGLFLQQAYHYFAGQGAPASAAKGAGLLHLLRDALATGGPHLLVLDGLERVQVQGGSGGEVFGQIEDPLLKGLLTRIAEGTGQTSVLVTSRFPLTDLAPYQGRGYVHLDVGGLNRDAALALLRYRGTQGDDAVLGRLIETYGAHALTLDHLGGLIGQFLGGDPGRAPEVPALPAPGSDRQALRLARLLRAYEEHLPAAELALLCRLCLLRRSVKEEHLLQLFLCSPAVHARSIRELEELIVHLPGAGRHPKEELPVLAESLRGFLEEALCAAPLAGPEELFRQQVCLALEKVWALGEQTIDNRIAEVARLYRDAHLDVPTDQRPLPADDREWLRALCLRYVELRGYAPLLVKSFDLDPALYQAFVELGWQKRTLRPPEDLHPSDVTQAFRRVMRRLRHLVIKHFALQGVREVCRLAQRKWSLAGPLAPLDAEGMRRVLDSLVGRHLVLREADGSFSVHPAVRDHFGRLASSTEQEGWHDFIREQLISLMQRPGRRQPAGPATPELNV
jgi:hypothetical protein